LVALDYSVLDASRMIDLRAGDVLLRLHSTQVPPSSGVVVVDIDQRSLEDMNDPKVNPAPVGSWPWPRSVHGELVDYIERQHPKAIVFDFLFDSPDNFRPEHDQAFAESVAGYNNVYFPATLNNDGLGARMGDMPKSLGYTPLPGGSADAHLPIVVPVVLCGQVEEGKAAKGTLACTHPESLRGGLINFDEDSDKVGRHYLLYRDRSGWRLPSLPARVAHDMGWAVPAGDRMMLNWRSRWDHVPYVDLYLDAQHEKSARVPDEFKDKVVVIGTAATGLEDLRVTPLGSLYPGADILATAVDNLRQGDWLRQLPRLSMLPLAVLLLVVLAHTFSLGWSANVIAIRLAGLNVLILAAAWLALRAGYWVPVYSALVCGWVYYLLGSLLAYLKERQERARAIGMFQRFLDPRVVTDLVARGEIDTRINAESRDVTVLFSDIRGFTTLSETRTPEFIVSLLNRYFSTQVEIIFRHGGTLDKFIGDAIMAFWGAPVVDPDHAKHAVAAAIEMSQALVRFKAELTDLGHDFDIGIGLNSGPAVVGFIGSQDRLDYTAIGDTVNLASRIEGQTKGVARVLVAESTRLAAGDAFDYRDCGVHHVKGREQGVQLFEPSIKP
ncbi:MAG: adenylate/guanylate cyclase domain-containing protein, partial [Burkholderiales bacterium]|nr:adenylate/guanylate cyclase domain-containing protein [Burkholderiales bacterium]